MATPVWLYVPNLIGYFRVCASFVAFYFAKERPLWAFFFYMASFLSDALDGHAARTLNQCSKMGAVLDMVTDRFSTAGLCVILAQFYPQLTMFFIFIISLDLASHYAQMNASLLRGSDSHKKVDKSMGLLHLYYTNRIVLGIVCLSAELVYVFLYVRHFFKGPVLMPDLLLGCDFYAVDIGLAVSAPLWALKQYLNVKQLVAALLSMDAPVPAAPMVAAPSADAAAAAAAGVTRSASGSSFSMRLTSPDGKVPAGLALSRGRAAPAAGPGAAEDEARRTPSRRSSRSATRTPTRTPSRTRSGGSKND